MNRIYQGKVTSVQKLKPCTKGTRPADWEAFDPDPKRARSQWETALWQHHELFQDAVNYYALALAGMAEGVNPDTAQGKAVLAWRAQVRDNWIDGRRKAIRYDGPHRRLAPWLGVEANILNEHAAFDACARAILHDNGSTSAQRAAALLQLLEEADKGGENKLSTVCVSRLPFLCSPQGKCSATPKSVSSIQEIQRQQLVRNIRVLPDPEALAQAPQLDLGLFLTQPPTEQVTGDDAVKMLHAYWDKAAKKFPALAPLKERFTASLAAAKNTLAVPLPAADPAVFTPLPPCSAPSPALKRWRSSVRPPGRCVRPRIRPLPRMRSQRCAWAMNRCSTTSPTAPFIAIRRTRTAPLGSSSTSPLSSRPSKRRTGIFKTRKSVKPPPIKSVGASQRWNSKARLTSPMMGARALPSDSRKIIASRCYGSW